jgi:TP901-1 family phage major tail protein
MAGKAGVNWLLKLGDGAGSETFTTIGGLRSNSLTLNREPIEATNKGSNQVRELLAAAGIKSASISGAGIYTTDATLTQLHTDWAAGTLRNFQLVDADSGLTISGAFMITSIERGGEYNGEMSWSMSAESSGTITIA